MGRTNTYNKEHEDEICQRIAMGESLNSICKSDDMPSDSTVIGWLMESKLDDEGNNVLVRAAFVENYTRARLISYQLMADGILDIVDDSRNDYVERIKVRANGDEVTEFVFDHENVQRSKLRAEKRQWFLSKVLPKIYGDHIQVTQDVTHKGTIQHKAAEGMNFGQVRDQRQKLRVIGGNDEPEE